MKSIIKSIFKIILIVLIIGVITLVIDLLRVNNNKLPVFSLTNYNKKSKIETYQGILYTFDRKIKTSLNEKISEDYSYNFKILFITIKKYKKNSDNSKDIKIELIKEEECTNSKLLDFNYEENLYSYCLEDIKINDVKTTVSSIKKIESKLKYLGYNSKAEIFGIDNLVVYKCNNEINDYYITSFDTNIGDDLCIKREIEKRKIK